MQALRTTTEPESTHFVKNKWRESSDEEAQAVLNEVWSERSNHTV